MIGGGASWSLAELVEALESLERAGVCSPSLDDGDLVLALAEGLA